MKKNKLKAQRDWYRELLYDLIREDQLNPILHSVLYSQRDSFQRLLGRPATLDENIGIIAAIIGHAKEFEDE